MSFSSGDNDDVMERLGLKPAMLKAIMTLLSLETCSESNVSTCSPVCFDAINAITALVITEPTVYH
jgi:hypothetical protein